MVPRVMCSKTVEAESPLVGCLCPLGDCELPKLVTLTNDVVGLPAEVAQDRDGEASGERNLLDDGRLMGP